MRKIFAAAVLTMGLAVFPKPAQAFLITGELDLSGAVRITVGGLMDFIPPTSPDTTGCPSGSSCGLEDISKTTNTGYFTVFNGATQWTIADLDLDVNLFPAGPIGSFPELLDFETTPSSIQSVFVPGILPAVCLAGGGTVVTGGCRFPLTSPLPQLTFSLLSIDPCTIGCGFGFAPQFNVTFTDGNTAIIMNVHGIVCDPGTPGAECNDYQGIFTAQFPDQSPTFLANLLTTQGYIQTSFSASKISTPEATVPEPATLLLFGTGSVFIAARARRRAKARKEAGKA
jgi:PEP-CTERM motif